MKKFKTLKRFSLDFLGKEWKEAYIDFERISIDDVKDVLPKFQTVDSKDEAKALEGIKNMISFLEGKFVSGKGVTKEGLVDLEASDLGALPAEVLSGALSFLSQGVAPTSPKP